MTQNDSNQKDGIEWQRQENEPFTKCSEPVGEVQELLFLRTQGVVGTLIWGIRWHRRTGHRVHVIRVVLGDVGWQDARLEGCAHRVMLVQELLERTDVLHGRAQGFNFAHLLVRRAVGYVLAERGEAVVHQFYPVAFSLVPPCHSVWLLLGQAVAKAREVKPPLASKQLRRRRALPLRLFWRRLIAALAVGRTELDALRGCGEKAGRWHELLVVYAYFHLGSDVQFPRKSAMRHKSFLWSAQWPRVLLVAFTCGFMRSLLPFWMDNRCSGLSTCSDLWDGISPAFSIRRRPAVRSPGHAPSRLLYSPCAEMRLRCVRQTRALLPLLSKQLLVKNDKRCFFGYDKCFWENKTTRTNYELLWKASISPWIF